VHANIQTNADGEQQYDQTTLVANWRHRLIFPQQLHYASDVRCLSDKTVTTVNSTVGVSTSNVKRRGHSQLPEKKTMHSAYKLESTFRVQTSAKTLNKLHKWKSTMLTNV